MSARRGGRVCGGGTRRGRPAVRMRRCCGPADVCGRVCVRVLILSLNTVKHVLPSFTVLVPADDVTAWTLTNLSGAAQARIFSGLSISTPRKCLNSFSFANRAFSSHLFSPPPSPRESALFRQAATGMAVAGKAAGRWEVAEGGCVLMEIGGGLFWRPAGPHQPCTSLSVAPLQRGPVWLGPVWGGQMVPFGEGPRHSAPCSRGSTGAARSKHGLLLLGTFRSFSL